MRAYGRRMLWLMGVLALCASAQQKGIEPDWNMRPVLQEIAAHAQRLSSVLEKIDAKGMLQNGAPDTYAAQIESSKAQAKALAAEALELANSPEKLSADLQAFLRILSLERTVPSIEQALRKYWNPALADPLSREMTSNGANRERFQRYIVELAAEREQEYAIMDHEAQRCRGMLAKQPKTEKK